MNLRSSEVLVINQGNTDTSVAVTVELCAAATVCHYKKLQYPLLLIMDENASAIFPYVLSVFILLTARAIASPSETPGWIVTVAIPLVISTSTDWILVPDVVAN